MHKDSLRCTAIWVRLRRGVGRNREDLGSWSITVFNCHRDFRSIRCGHILLDIAVLFIRSVRRSVKSEGIEHISSIFQVRFTVSKCADINGYLENATAFSRFGYVTNNKVFNVRYEPDRFVGLSIGCWLKRKGSHG